MENKNIQKKNNPTWIKRTAMVAMAAILAATGLKSCGKKEENGSAITKPKIIDKEIEEIIKEDETEEVIEEIIETEEPKKEVNFFDTIDLSNYTGYSIVDALELNEYRSDFEFREELANYFGFDPYKGTEEQNLALLKLLGAHVPEENRANTNNANDNVYTNSNSNGNANENNSQENSSNGQAPSGGDCPECEGELDPNKDHKHLFTEWVYLNTKKEQRVCLICGKKEKRNHSLKDATTKYVYQNNGTHQVITITGCKTCNFEKKTVLIDKCSIKEWKYDPKLKKNVGMCSECGGLQTREPDRHEHQYRLIDTKYDVNDDETHTRTDTFECIAKDDIKTYSYSFPHTYSDWKLNPETGLYERHCYLCKHKQSRIHTDDHNYERIIEYFPIEGDEEYHRVVVKDVCKYGDDVKIISDTKEKHGFDSNWIYNSKTGMDEMLCSKCGYIHTRVHKHEIEKIIESVEISGNHEKHIKRIIHKCPICNEEEIVSETEEEHTYGNWTPNSSNTEKSRTCSKCHHVHTEEIKEEHEHNYVKKEERIEIPGNDEQHILRTIDECECGDIILISEDLENHVYGAFVPNSSNTQETGTCDLCNHIYTRDIAQHEHDYKYLDPATYASLYAEKGINPEIYELLRCEADGALTTIAHELGSPVIDGCATTKTCSHDYCNHQEVEYSHIESDRFKDYVSSEDVCKLVDVVCSKCSEVLETNVERDHSYVDASEQYNAPGLYTCECGRYKRGNKTGMLDDIFPYMSYNLRSEDEYLVADVSIEDDKVLKRSLTK